MDIVAESCMLSAGIGYLQSSLLDREPYNLVMCQERDRLDKGFKLLL